jgi:hypothetical protein
MEVEMKASMSPQANEEDGDEAEVKARRVSLSLECSRGNDSKSAYQ